MLGICGWSTTTSPSPPTLADSRLSVVHGTEKITRVTKTRALHAPKRSRACTAKRPYVRERGFHLGFMVVARLVDGPPNSQQLSLAAASLRMEFALARAWHGRTKGNAHELSRETHRAQRREKSRARCCFSIPCDVRPLDRVGPVHLLHRGTNRMGGVCVLTSGSGRARFWRRKWTIPLFATWLPSGRQTGLVTAPFGFRGPGV